MYELYIRDRLLYSSLFACLLAGLIFFYSFMSIWCTLRLQYKYLLSSNNPLKCSIDFYMTLHLVKCLICTTAVDLSHSNDNNADEIHCVPYTDLTQTEKKALKQFTVYFTHFNIY